MSEFVPQLLEHRRFALIRHEDVSGVSGTGMVAVGWKVVVQDTPDCHPVTRVMLVWLNGGGVGLYDSVEHVERIHGHDGATRLEWVE